MSGWSIHFREFAVAYWLAFKKFRPWGAFDTATSIFAVVGAIIAYEWPRVISVGEFEAIAGRIALFALLGAIAFRLLATPYVIWRDERSGALQLAMALAKRDSAEEKSERFHNNMLRRADALLHFASTSPESRLEVYSRWRDGVVSEARELVGDSVADALREGLADLHPNALLQKETYMQALSIRADTLRGAAKWHRPKE